MLIRQILPTSLAALILLAGCGGDREVPPPSEVVRSFVPKSRGRWIGNAICYGPHRDGQRPGGPSPTTDQIREDLQLMLPHWNLLRLYGSSGIAENILEVIRADALDMKVVLGAWIGAEAHRRQDGTLAIDPDEAAANRREVQNAIRLANAYPEIVLAVSVGNETQVSWAAHRSPLELVIEHVRAVRAGVQVPVTSADDLDYWITPESRALAHELDFITLHAHPLWKGQELADALSWLESQVAAVQDMHPGCLIVLGETGWATSVADAGEQAELIKGTPGEAEQKVFHDQVRAWADQTRLAVFWFEAFDENWKGGDDPAEVEKHWGLYRADRSPKQALAP